MLQTHTTKQIKFLYASSKQLMSNQRLFLILIKFAADSVFLLILQIFYSKSIWLFIAVKQLNFLILKLNLNIGYSYLKISIHKLVCKDKNMDSKFLLYEPTKVLNKS